MSGLLDIRFRTYPLVMTSFALATLLPRLSAEPATTTFESVTIDYGEQEVEITHLVNTGEPFIRAFVDGDDGSLIWINYTLSGVKLMRSEYADGKWDNKNPKEVFNFGKRSFWSPHYNDKDKSFYLVSDDYNDETFNSYRVNFASQKLEQVTHHAYQPQTGFSADKKALLAIAKLQKTGNDACLYKTAIDEPEADSQSLFCSAGETYLYPFQPPHEDSKTGTIAFTVYPNSDRSRLNLVLLKPGSDTIEYATDVTQKRARLAILGWHEGDLYYIANNNNTSPQLYRLDAQTQRSEVIHSTDDQASLTGYLAASQGKIYFEQRAQSDQHAKIGIIDLDTDDVRTVDSTDVYTYLDWAAPLPDGSLAVNGHLRDDSTTLAYFRINPSAKADSDVVAIGFSKATPQIPVQACKTSTIEYATFDNDPETGAKRKISAVLFEPREQPVGEPAAVVFAHGGPSARTSETPPALVSFLCTLGYTVIGPNPRGSTGFGQNFEDLNNQDWGGGDWLDYEHARRYLVRDHNIPESRIGITGSSFGGYMTNWAMTRPNNKFAFGISDHGMADLLLQVEHSVVKDNIISDMGDPEINSELYRERSPVHYAQYISKPFLLTHGSRDFRTYFGDTRLFVSRLKAYSSAVRYLEIEGEGHGYRYPDTLTKYYQTLANFLYEVAPVKKQ